VTAHIFAVRTYLPETVVTNDALAKDIPNWNPVRVGEKTGIHERRVATDAELTSTLAVRAAERLFREAQVDRASIEQLIVCTQTPDHLIPSTACLVHEMLCLPTACGAFDINMGCSGYIYGLSTARAYVDSRQANRVLLVNADTYTKLIRKDDGTTRALFGDGATATLVSDVEVGGRIGPIAFGTDGSRYRDFVAVNSALARDDAPGRFITMDGPSIFNFTIEQVPRGLESFLATNGLKKSEIRYFVLHQANSYILSHLQKKMQIESPRVPMRLGNVGNLVSASIPSVVEEIGPTLVRGDKIVLVGFGVGLSWGFALVTWH
jgi:3-oxoacyl-[acyl-carrier-protein] synthase-3